MQLTSDASVPNPAKPVSSDYVADSSSPNAMVDVGVEGEELVEEESDLQRQDEIAGLFSGMDVSGVKAPRQARPTQPVQPVRRVKPSASTTRGKKQREESSAFGDLLGLVRWSNSSTTAIQMAN